VDLTPPDRDGRDAGRDAAGDPGRETTPPRDTSGPDAMEASARPEAGREAPPPSPDAPVCAETLVAHWALDGNADDESCHLNAGTLRGYVTPDWRPGRIGGALGFDGAGQWVNVADRPDLNLIATRGQLTIAAWTYRTAAARSMHQVILSRQSSTVLLQEHYALFFSGVDNRLAAQLNSWQSPVALCSDPGDPPLNRWVHAAVTYDGATMILYRDGAEVCRKDVKLTLIPADKPIIIGGNVNDAGEVPTRLFPGMLDDVLLYARALTPTEIGQVARGLTPPRQ
jgi:hypothetical protein